MDIPESLQTQNIKKKKNPKKPQKTLPTFVIDPKPSRLPD